MTGTKTGHSLDRTATLQTGDFAPNFELPATGGRKIKLGDYLGKKNLVLYFYPRDFTPV